MQTRAEILPFNRAPRTAPVQDVFTFDSVYELCAFIQHEIHAAKRKYSDLARQANVCPATVSKMASGETKSPRAATALAILAALGFEVVVRR